MNNIYRHATRDCVVCFTGKFISVLLFSIVFSVVMYAQKTSNNIQQSDTGPTADAGPDQTVCAGEPILLNGSFGGSATSGTFYLLSLGPEGLTKTQKAICPPPSNCDFQLVPPPTLIGATEPIIQTYVFETDDPAGSFGPASDTVIVTINPVATADAGPDQTICTGAPVVLKGTFGGAASSGSFSGGTGTMSGNIYSPSVAEVNAGHVTLAYTTNDPEGPCPAVRDLVTINIAPCGPYCAYTQAFYAKNKESVCTSETKIKTKDLIAESINNMPGHLLYLGAGDNSTSKGGSFTASVNRAAILNHILPGDGSSEILIADYNLFNPTKYPPLKKGKLTNTLLAQSITLALNIYITDISKSVGSIQLKDNWIVTGKRSASTTCSDPKPALCADDPGAVQSWYLPPGVLLALGGNNTVSGLLKMASEALGGIIPKGVTLDDIAAAVGNINSAFNDCRYLIGFYHCAKTCINLEEECSSISKRPLANSSTSSLNKTQTLKVIAFPNPYTDQVKFTIQSRVSGNGRLEVYNMLGQKVQTIYQGYLFAGSSRIIDYKIPSKNKSNLVYVLKVGNHTVSGKLMHSY